MFFHENKLQDFFSRIMMRIEDIILILNWMSIEFFDLKTFFYYFILSFLSLLVTSIQKFYPARASVLLSKHNIQFYDNNYFFKVIFFNFLFERICFNSDLYVLFGGIVAFENHNLSFLQIIFLLR